MNDHLPPGSERYFDKDGVPTTEYIVRWNAVALRLADFDGTLILDSLLKNWTVEETVAEGKRINDERDEEARAYASDFEFQLDRDMSMNY